MKFLTDLHTHCFPASHDATSTLPEMLAAAQKKGMGFFGLSNHVDYDYDFSAFSKEEKEALVNGDEEEFFHAARHLQEDYEGVMNVLIGAEFGYSEDKGVQKRYQEFCEKFAPDYVVNSVHSYGGVDYAHHIFTQEKKEIYGRYLRQIRSSLDVVYPYDIVAHIEYIVRYVPFAEREITLAEFGAEIDDILSAIVKKGKILEVNSSTKELPRISLPSEAIVKRYYELGGRNVSYGSDAHSIARIGEKREEIVRMLKEIGFTHLTVPCRGEYIKVEL